MSARDLLEGLVLRKETLAFAESCTAGQACANFGSLSGASQVLNESVITYSNASKNHRLHVPLSALENYGAVSSEVVALMSKGVCLFAQADLGIAISGIAGPTGGTEDKPVGLVWFGVTYKGTTHTQSQKFNGDRVSIQSQAAAYAIDFAWTHFKSSNMM